MQVHHITTIESKQKDEEILNDKDSLLRIVAKVGSDNFIIDFCHKTNTSSIVASSEAPHDGNNIVRLLQTEIVNLMLQNTHAQKSSSHKSGKALVGLVSKHFVCTNMATEKVSLHDLQVVLEYITGVSIGQQRLLFSPPCTQLNKATTSLANAAKVATSEIYLLKEKVGEYTIGSPSAVKSLLPSTKPHVMLLGQPTQLGVIDAAAHEILTKEGDQTSTAPSAPQDPQKKSVFSSDITVKATTTTNSDPSNQNVIRSLDDLLSDVALLDLLMTKANEARANAIVQAGPSGLDMDMLGENSLDSFVEVTDNTTGNQIRRPRREVLLREQFEKQLEIATRLESQSKVDRKDASTIATTQYRPLEDGELLAAARYWGTMQANTFSSHRKARNAITMCHRLVMVDPFAHILPNERKGNNATPIDEIGIIERLVPTLPGEELSLRTNGAFSRIFWAFLIAEATMGGSWAALFQFEKECKAEIQKVLDEYHAETEELTSKRKDSIETKQRQGEIQKVIKSRVAPILDRYLAGQRATTVARDFGDEVFVSNTEVSESEGASSQGDKFNKVAKEEMFKLLKYYGSVATYYEGIKEKQRERRAARRAKRRSGTERRHIPSQWAEENLSIEEQEEYLEAMNDMFDDLSDDENNPLEGGTSSSYLASTIFSALEKITESESLIRNTQVFAPIASIDKWRVPILLSCSYAHHAVSPRYSAVCQTCVRRGLTTHTHNLCAVCALTCHAGHSVVWREMSVDEGELTPAFSCDCPTDAFKSHSSVDTRYQHNCHYLVSKEADEVTARAKAASMQYPREFNNRYPALMQFEERMAATQSIFNHEQEDDNQVPSAQAIEAAAMGRMCYCHQPKDKVHQQESSTAAISGKEVPLSIQPQLPGPDTIVDRIESETGLKLCRSSKLEHDKATDSTVMNSTTGNSAAEMVSSKACRKSQKGVTACAGCSDLFSQDHLSTLDARHVKSMGCHGRLPTDKHAVAFRCRTCVFDRSANYKKDDNANKGASPITAAEEEDEYVRQMIRNHINKKAKESLDAAMTDEAIESLKKGLLVCAPCAFRCHHSKGHDVDFSVAYVYGGRESLFRGARRAANKKSTQMPNKTEKNNAHISASNLHTNHNLKASGALGCQITSELELGGDEEASAHLYAAHSNMMYPIIKRHNARLAQGDTRRSCLVFRPLPNEMRFFSGPEEDAPKIQALIAKEMESSRLEFMVQKNTRSQHAPNNTPMKLPTYPANDLVDFSPDHLYDKGTKGNLTLVCAMEERKGLMGVEEAHNNENPFGDESSLNNREDSDSDDSEGGPYYLSNDNDVITMNDAAAADGGKHHRASSKLPTNAPWSLPIETDELEELMVIFDEALEMGKKELKTTDHPPFLKVVDGSLLIRAQTLVFAAAAKEGFVARRIAARERYTFQFAPVKGGQDNANKTSITNKLPSAFLPTSHLLNDSDDNITTLDESSKLDDVSGQDVHVPSSSPFTPPLMDMPLMDPFDIMQGMIKPMWEANSMLKSKQQTELKNIEASMKLDLEMNKTYKSHKDQDGKEMMAFSPINSGDIQELNMVFHMGLTGNVEEFGDDYWTNFDGAQVGFMCGCQSAAIFGHFSADQKSLRNVSAYSALASQRCRIGLITAVESSDEGSKVSPTTVVSATQHADGPLSVVDVTCSEPAFELMHMYSSAIAIPSVPATRSAPGKNSKADDNLLFEEMLSGSANAAARGGQRPLTIESAQAMRDALLLSMMILPDSDISYFERIMKHDEGTFASGTEDVTANSDGKDEALAVDLQTTRVSFYEKVTGMSLNTGQAVLSRSGGAQSTSVQNNPRHLRQLYGPFSIPDHLYEDLWLADTRLKNSKKADDNPSTADENNTPLISQADRASNLTFSSAQLRVLLLYDHQFSLLCNWCIERHQRWVLDYKLSDCRVMKALVGAEQKAFATPLKMFIWPKCCASHVEPEQHLLSSRKPKCVRGSSDDFTTTYQYDYHGMLLPTSAFSDKYVCTPATCNGRAISTFHKLSLNPDGTSCYPPASTVLSKARGGSALMLKAMKKKVDTVDTKNNDNAHAQERNDQNDDEGDDDEDDFSHHRMRVGDPHQPPQLLDLGSYCEGFYDYMLPDRNGAYETLFATTTAQMKQEVGERVDYKGIDNTEGPSANRLATTLGIDPLSFVTNLDAVETHPMSLNKKFEGDEDGLLVGDAALMSRRGWTIDTQHLKSDFTTPSALSVPKHHSTLDEALLCTRLSTVNECKNCGGSVSLINAFSCATCAMPNLLKRVAKAQLPALRDKLMLREHHDSEMIERYKRFREAKPGRKEELKKMNESLRQDAIKVGIYGARNEVETQELAPELAATVGSKRNRVNPLVIDPPTELATSSAVDRKRRRGEDTVERTTSDVLEENVGTVNDSDSRFGDGFIASLLSVPRAWTPIAQRSDEETDDEDDDLSNELFEALDSDADEKHAKERQQTVVPAPNNNDIEAVKDGIREYIRLKEELRDEGAHLSEAYEVVKQRRGGKNKAKESAKSRDKRIEKEISEWLESITESLTVEDILAYLKEELTTKSPMMLAMSLMFEPQGAQQHIYCHRCALLPPVERAAHPQSHTFFPTLKVQKILAFKDALSTDMMRSVMEESSSNGVVRTFGGKPEGVSADLGQNRAAHSQKDSLPTLLSPIPASAAAAEAERKQQRAMKFPSTSAVGKLLASFEQDDENKVVGPTKTATPTSNKHLDANSSASTPATATSDRPNASTGDALSSLLDSFLATDVSYHREGLHADETISVAGTQSTHSGQAVASAAHAKSMLQRLIAHHRAAGRVILPYPSDDSAREKPVQ